MEAIQEIPEYYRPYLALVQEDELIAALENSMTKMERDLLHLSEEQAMHRYAEGKWSIKDIVQHLIDTERIFSYRALTIARSPGAELPGYDHNAYVAAAHADERSLEDLMQEYFTLREATMSLFGSFSEQDIQQKGKANNFEQTPLLIGFVIAGHQLHHLRVIQERYLG